MAKDIISKYCLREVVVTVEDGTFQNQSREEEYFWRKPLRSLCS